MAFANGDGETRFFFLFYRFFLCSLAEEARKCVDVHLHRVYIEDTYVRSISMYEVSVLLLLYYNKQYLPRAVSSPKYVGWICMTTIKDTRTLFLRGEMRELYVYVYVCMYPQQQQQPTASCTCDMESSSSCTVNVVA